MPAPILVTGAAGFIGHAVAHRLLARGERVIGVDIVNDYYDPALKEARLATFTGINSFAFERLDIADADKMKALVCDNNIVRVVHLAAQAGVRYSLENPFAYERSNLAGHLSVMEACRHAEGFEHLVYASSSSVYGDKPISGEGFKEDEPANDPVSLYAATKRACELMSQSYAKLYGFPQTGLRFFTVYGPWGRPDMAYFSFTQKILRGEAIEVYGNGHMARDFTYVTDLVRSIRLLIDTPPPLPHTVEPIAGDTLSPVAPWRVVNIGNSDKVKLLDFVDAIEQALGRKAQRTYLPMQAGDVPATWADASLLRALTGYAPKTDVKDGIAAFVAWYREYYNV